jgi:hypothetical protein
LNDDLTVPGSGLHEMIKNKGIIKIIENKAFILLELKVEENFHEYIDMPFGRFFR